MSEEILPTLDEVKELIRIEYEELEKDILKQRKKERDEEDAERLKIITENLK